VLSLAPFHAAIRFTNMGSVYVGVSFLRDQMLASDLAIEVPELDPPVYFLHGK